jgi:Bacterial Ig-like domain (group 1)
MMSILKRVAALASVLVMTACGGGGTGLAGGGGGGGGVTPPPTVTSVEVVSSAVQVGTAGEQVQISAIVRGAGNVTLPAIAVTFAADSGSLTLASTVTNATGVATAQFSAGADKSNRPASITVTAGGVSGSVAVEIAGTKITVTGPSTLQFAGTSALSVKVADSAGAAIGGATVAVTSQLGAGLSSASLTTNAQGAATVTYTANRAGSDSVQFASLGATGALGIAVSGEDFAVTSPAPGVTIPIGQSQAITATYRINGAPAAGPYAVRFASTAGTLSPASASLGVALTGGQATASVSSTFAGPATVQATLVNTTTNAVLAQASLAVQFVAVTPSALVLQITPTAIGPNGPGSTTRQATVRATVVDVSGNPVQGAIVNFSKDADPSGGNLSQASGSTDPNGNASVQFIAGATPTAADAVRLRATVAGTGIFGTATMTVNQTALFIGLGTGNEISNAPGTNNTAYLKIWTAYVTDSNGAAVSNQALTVSVLPTRYRKGSYALLGDDWSYEAWDGVSVTPGGFLPAGMAVTCANEDTDYSGVITLAKDVNGSGRLEPGNVISVNGGPSVLTVVTDGSGFATLNLVYAESYASWVEVVLKVTATVAGTESSNQSTFWVRGLKSDFSTDGGPPAGQLSPFGQKPSCVAPD